MAKASDNMMKPKKFRLGLKLAGDREAAAQPIESMPAPDVLYVSLKQSRGGSCSPKVAAGDPVKKGQPIAESADPDSVPVHSPVSGKVRSVGDHPDASGAMVATVTIENDGQDAWAVEPKETPDFLHLGAADMLRRIRYAGVVEAKRGRPLFTQLTSNDKPRSYDLLVAPIKPRAVDVLIVSALDAEPNMAANRRLLIEQPQLVRQGIDLLKKIVHPGKTLLVAGDDLGDGSSALKMAAGGDGSMIVENRYPVAFPEILTSAVTGRELPWPGGRPRDVGVLVVDVDAVLNVLEAVRTGKPQIERVITVSLPKMKPRNLRVPIGTAIKDIVAFAGGDFNQAAKVVLGGVMSGAAQYSGLTAVTRQTTALTVMDPEKLVKFTEHLCIKCGKCVAVCPVRIQPNMVANFCEFGYYAEAESAEIFKCIECGCCAYVCPAKRPMVHYIKHGKAEASALEAKK